MMLVAGIVIGLLMAIFCALIVKSQSSPKNSVSRMYGNMTASQAGIVQTKDTLTEVMEAEKP